MPTKMQHSRAQRHWTLVSPIPSSNRLNHLLLAKSQRTVPANLRGPARSGPRRSATVNDCQQTKMIICADEFSTRPDIPRTGAFL